MPLPTAAESARAVDVEGHPDRRVGDEPAPGASPVSMAAATDGSGSTAAAPAATAPGASA
ncbi:hypothetical protein [Streptomyces sp. NPDC051636]|uniref:hypothetical protein n=1 Tax=Streptomyces sp. NPDC051636 TaxID=3365663 RepID=UPI00378BB30B